MTYWNAILSALCAAALTAGCQNPSTPSASTAAPAGGADVGFSFAVTADMREFTGPKHPGPQFFEGVCAALKAVGPGDFMITAGDMDPVPPVRATLDRFLGSNYVWYPVVGNHELGTRGDIAWVRAWGSNAIPGLVRRGPPNCETTTYSFDHGPAHFVALNVYCDGKSDMGAGGDVTEAVHDWLAADLAANRKPFVFVVGHEPIVPLPDMDNGRLRHKGSSLDRHPANDQRFLDLLHQHHVTAYLCGHTHNTSVTNLAGVWQLDAGHARGMGDKGARSTFMKIEVKRAGCRLDVYRDDGQGGEYSLTKSVKLD